MPVMLREACDDDRELIKNIFNIYQNELSAYSDEFSRLDSRGYFDSAASDGVLPFGSGVFPYIIYDEKGVIGFIMATGAPYAPKDADWCFQEFFIVTSMRSTGCALDSAKRVMQNRFGRWALDVYARNARAVAFWRRLIKSVGSSAVETDIGGGMIRLYFEYAEGYE